MTEQNQKYLLPVETTIEFNGKSLVIQKVIGQGADGQVYKGLLQEAGQPDKPVAIKASLRFQQETNLFVQDAFTTQIDTINALNNKCTENGREPVAPRYYGRSTHEGVPFFVMEFLQGAQLYQEEYGQVTRQPSEGQTLIAFAEFFETLSYLHSAGIILADMKLENLYWEGNMDPASVDGRLRIIDLGSTLKLDESAQGSGNPAFDVLRASVLLCRVLTGYSPVIDQMTVKTNILSLLEDANDKISWGTKLLLRRLLNKTPASRPATAEEAAKLVRELAEIWANSDDALYERIYRDETKLRSIPENASEDAIKTERRIANRARSTISILQTRSPGFNAEQVSAYLDSIQLHIDRRDDLRIGLIFLEAFNFASAIRSFVNGLENSFTNSQGSFRRLIYISLAALQQTEVSVREKIGSEGMQAVLLLNDNNVPSALTRLTALRDTVGTNRMLDALIAECNILVNLKDMEASELKGDLASALQKITEARQWLQKIPERAELDGYLPDFAGRVSDRADFEANEIGNLQEKEDHLHKRSGAGEQEAASAKLLAEQGDLQAAEPFCLEAFNVNPESSALQEALLVYCKKAFEKRDFLAIHHPGMRRILNYYPSASGFAGAVAISEYLDDAGKQAEASNIDGAISRIRKTLGWQVRWPEIVPIWDELISTLVKKCTDNVDDIGLEKVIEFVQELPQGIKLTQADALPEILSAVREKTMLRYAPEIDLALANVEGLLSGSGLPEEAVGKANALLLKTNSEAATLKAIEILKSVGHRVKASRYKQDLWREKLDACDKTLESIKASDDNSRREKVEQEQSLWKNCQDSVDTVRRREAERSENPANQKLEQSLQEAAGQAFRYLFMYQAQFGATYNREIDPLEKYIRDILDRYGKYGWEAVASAIKETEKFTAREKEVIRLYEEGLIDEACAGFVELYGENVQVEEAADLWRKLSLARKLVPYVRENRAFFESTTFALPSVEAACQYIAMDLPNIYTAPFKKYLENLDNAIRASIARTGRSPRQNAFLEDLRHWVDFKSASLAARGGREANTTSGSTNPREFLKNVYVSLKSGNSVELERIVDSFVENGGKGTDITQLLANAVFSEFDGKEKSRKVFSVLKWVGGGIAGLLLAGGLAYAFIPEVPLMIFPPTETPTATPTKVPTRTPKPTLAPSPTPTVPTPTHTAIIGVSKLFAYDLPKIYPPLPLVSSQVWVLDSSTVKANPPLTDHTKWEAGAITRPDGQQETVYSTADTTATVDWALDTQMNQTGKFAVYVFDPAQASSGGSWKYTMILNGQPVKPNAGSPVVTLNTKSDLPQEDKWVLAGIYHIGIGQTVQIHTEFAGDPGNNSLPVGKIVLIRLNPTDEKYFSQLPTGRELGTLFDTRGLKYFANNLQAAQGWTEETEPSTGSTFIWTQGNQTMGQMVNLTSGGKVPAGEYEMIACIPQSPHAQAAVTFDLLLDDQKLPVEAPRMINEATDAGKCVSVGLWTVTKPGNVSVNAVIPAQSPEAALDWVALYRKQ